MSSKDNPRTLTRSEPGMTQHLSKSVRIAYLNNGTYRSVGRDSLTHRGPWSGDTPNVEHEASSLEALHHRSRVEEPLCTLRSGPSNENPNHAVSRAAQDGRESTREGRQETSPTSAKHAGGPAATTEKTSYVISKHRLAAEHPLAPFSDQ